MAPPARRNGNKSRTKALDRLAAIVPRGRDASRARQSKSTSDGLPDAIQDLLAEAAESLPRDLNIDRPLKRRRIDGAPHPAESVSSDANAARPAVIDSSLMPIRQTIVLSSDDHDQDDDDEVDWEQIPLDAPQSDTHGLDPAESDKDIVGVSVSIDANTTPAANRHPRRKVITNQERVKRLATHKTHILFLLFHVHIINAWCHSKHVESNLRKVLPAKLITSMNPDSAWPQLRQSNSFLDGLKAAMEIWKVKFRVVSSGLHKPQWYDDDEALQERIHELEAEMDVGDKSDFVKASSTLRGSQDLSNQLFCALLRAVGVDSRLVCSLQPLPFTAAGPKQITPRKSKPQVLANDHNDYTSDVSTDELSTKGSSSDVTLLPVSRLGSARHRRRIGQPSFGLPVGNYRQAPEKEQRRRVRKLLYPVFWVEAFNPAYQKWIAVDAAATFTVGKSTKLEPPASYEPNQLSYVVALEDDGTLKDVTQRYAHAFNAKTRKLRVEYTDGGDRWWKDAIKPFRRSHRLDRDQLEDAELASKALREGMPANIQDFKDHPIYALERHLKRQEVISPRREVGKVSVGKGASSTLEPVFRRRDVQIVRSAEKWYRLGREIKSAEQALKHVPARSRKLFLAEEDSGDDEAAELSLYAFHQTQPYVPPPVVGGRIPKNAFGNLDVYVPSMVPPGGIHIRHNMASKAARLLAIDYADSVVGFQFKGRHGTAITNGAVVAEEYSEAVLAVVQGFEHELQSAEDAARSLECLGLWKRFLTGLRIARRIGLHSRVDSDVAAGDEDKSDINKQLNAAEDEAEKTADSGGFFPNPSYRSVAQPTASRFRPPAYSRTKRTPPPAQHPPPASVTPSAPAKVAKVAWKTLIDLDAEDEIYNPSEHDIGGGFPIEKVDLPVAKAKPNDLADHGPAASQSQTKTDGDDACSPISIGSGDASSDVYPCSLPSRDPKDEQDDAEPDWLDGAIES